MSNKWNREKHEIRTTEGHQAVTDSSDNLVGFTITPPVIPIVDPSSDFDRFAFQQD